MWVFHIKVSDSASGGKSSTIAEGDVSPAPEAAPSTEEVTDTGKVDNHVDLIDDAQLNSDRQSTIRNSPKSQGTISPPI